MGYQIDNNVIIICLSTVVYDSINQDPEDSDMLFSAMVGEGVNNWFINVW